MPIAPALTGAIKWQSSKDPKESIVISGAGCNGAYSPELLALRRSACIPEFLKNIKT